jgi:hypothetical protein
MNSSKKTARLAGLLYLLAAVTGGGLLLPAIDIALLTEGEGSKPRASAELTLLKDSSPTS